MPHRSHDSECHRLGVEGSSGSTPADPSTPPGSGMGSNSLGLSTGQAGKRRRISELRASWNSSSSTDRCPSTVVSMTAVCPGYRSLGDLVDVLYSQPTLNERRDEDVMPPTENPETGGAAVRPTKAESLSVSFHRVDHVER